jgi:transmembrane sensor
MNKNDLARLIHRYRSGVATDQENEELDSFFQEASTDSSFLDSLSAAEKQFLRDEMYANIKRQLSQTTRKKATPSIPLYYKVAATITLLVAFSAIILFNKSNGVTEIKTAYGEILKVTLPDNSIVTLNGNSKLTYHNNWDGREREVWIEGEGFFEVQHTASHEKFIVHAAEQLNVEVLGTKFNVRSRGEKPEVLLTEGKVKLGFEDSRESAMFLEPGEMATVREEKLVKHSVAGKQHTAWLAHKLFFDKMPLSEVATRLQDTYGLEIRFENEALKDRLLSGEISTSSVDDILIAIKETFDIDVRREGNQVILSDKPVPSE